MLVQRPHIPCGIAEKGGNFRCNLCQRVEQSYRRCKNRLNCFFHIQYHNTDYHCWFGSRFTTGYPHTTHLSYSIIEGNVSITLLSEFPSKYFVVKRRRSIDICRRYFYITYFTISEVGRFEFSITVFTILFTEVLK